jgi:hypothetical protein
VQAVLDRIDLQALIDRLDLNEVLANVDIDQLAGTPDLGALIQRIDERDRRPGGHQRRHRPRRHRRSRGPHRGRSGDYVVDDEHREHARRGPSAGVGLDQFVIAGSSCAGRAAILGRSSARGVNMARLGRERRPA